MKKISELLEKRIEYQLVTGDINTEVSEVVFDSREVKGGELFVAVCGMTVDGHSFISKVIEGGAAAIVGEDFTQSNIDQADRHGVVLVKVINSLADGGVLVAARYDFPFAKMKMIGVTGTDGKTTTTNVIYALLKALRKKVGLVSTVSAKLFDGQNEWEVETGAHVTTPDATLVQSLLAKMVQQGCEYAVLEVTSHGLVQQRLAGVNFDVVAVTNITHEHTDFHKSFENYLAAKAMIFQIDHRLPQKDSYRVAYINADDPKSAGFTPFAGEWDLRSFSLEGNGILNAKVKRLGVEGSSFEISGIRYETGLVGKYNVANVVCAIGIVQAMGFGLDELVEGVRSLAKVPGRFEVVSSSEHGKIVVDFAHTPNAMESVLSFVRNHHQGRLLVVFGCAGLRDVEKRPLMGRIAGRLADVIIVTSEDPRTEDVDEISNQIVEGLEAVGSVEIKITNYNDQIQKIRDGFGVFLRVNDRLEAIRLAITSAEKNDVVMVLGKGHEKSMCFGQTEVPWSDFAAVRKILAELE